jgi:predicted DNA-binding transcriptional regulator YafY
MNKVGRPAGSHTQAVRIVRILRRLYRNELLELSELAEYLGVTVRTLRRDLHAIQRGGVKLQRNGTKFWLAADQKTSEPVRVKSSGPDLMARAKEKWL